ncbi:MAG: endonuclease [Oscillospiraceae bacterium]|nr:endonuclease [Oscillospiraceae bacterium]
MKEFFKRYLSVGLALLLVLSVAFSGSAAPAAESTIATGYTRAEDVVYYQSGNYIANWGAREEECVFLSMYAASFYSGENTYAAFSQMDGESGQTSSPNSELYNALQDFMVSKHTHQTTYGDTRYQYKYTDCVRNNTAKFSSFYSGVMHSSTWDQGNTWNREHTWPASKSLSGRPSNGEDGEGADIIMLRPTLKAENGSRSNDAFGESSGFYEPDDSIKGDCARITLYVYTRWGNSQYMWGSSGVIENLSVLLKWMEEDPVDTWEMGRNDAVQAITGTRNVFVDYPELAWHLFGQTLPQYMTTPSRGHVDNPNAPATNPTQATQSTQATQATQATQSTQATQATQATQSTQATQATRPNQSTQATQPVQQPTASTQPNIPVDPTQTTQPGVTTEPTTSGSQPTTPAPTTGTNATDATNATTQSPVESTGKAEEECPGEHSFGQWEILKEANGSEKGLKTRKCSVCGHTEAETIPAEQPTSYVWVIVVIVVAAGAITAGVLLFLQRRQRTDLE